jgi:hypothetical protein
MTPEDITLLTKLQVVFKERMGEWQLGDHIIHGKRSGVIDCVGMKEEAIDSGVLRIRWVENGIDNGIGLIFDEYWNDILRVPLAIDPINPERGLVEMLDRYHSLDYYFNNCWKLSCETKNGKPINVEAPDPYTALLKALCEQENIK